MINVNDTTLGLVSAAVPLLIIGFLILRRLPWIFAFFVALLAVGLGYLETTGAVRDFGHKVRVMMPEGIVSGHKSHTTESPPAEKPAEAPATAPASPPAEQPAPTPETPPPTPPTAPESTPAPSTTPPADNSQPPATTP